MQNKGFVKVFAVLLALVCIFYLSFSFVTSHYEGKAAKIAAVEGEAAGQHYLDSLLNEPVYFGAESLAHNIGRVRFAREEHCEIAASVEYLAAEGGVYDTVPEKLFVHGQGGVCEQ